MEPKVSYVLVGIFVFVLAAAALAIVLWLSRADYRGVYDRYYVYMTESVSGLSADASVKYRGVDVGRVKEIVLNPKNPEEVRLALDLARGTPVKEDTVAVLETQGLTGLTTVNLMGGTRDSPPLAVKPGERYPVIRTSPSFYFRLDSAISRILNDESLPALLTNLNNLADEARGLMDAQTRADFKRILGNLAEISRTVSDHREQIVSVFSNVEVASERLAAASRKIDQEFPALIDDAKSSLRSLQDMTRSLTRASASVQAALDDNRSDIDQFTGQTLPDSGSLVAELRELTATLQRVARELEAEPGILVFGRSHPVRGPGE